MPEYCETRLCVPGTFPAEPINAATSFVPVVLGALALLFLSRRTDQGYVAYGLAALLLLTGLGSIAWHSFRTDLALILDALPGVLYAIVLVFFWFYYLGGRFFGAIPIGLVAAIIVVLGPESPDEARIVVAGQVLTLAAGLLIATWLCKPQAFKLALATAVCALVAVTFRTLDLNVCEIIPFGTHFFWHIFLGIAGYTGVRMVMVLRKATPETLQNARVSR